jgi:hypothetical protein
MTNSTNQETITFYDVPLVCGAAPSIGCGSRAKPLIIDLEQQTQIKEAWLNRTGTIVAIVWRGQACMEEVGKPSPFGCSVLKNQRNYFKISRQ